MLPVVARQALHNLALALTRDRRPDFAWAIEHAPDGDTTSAAIRLWHAAGRCVERRELAGALGRVIDSELYKEALEEYRRVEFCWAFDGLRRLLTDVDTYGHPSAQWLQAYGTEGAQASLETIWASSEDPSAMRRLLVMIDPERARQNPPEWNYNYPPTVEEVRDIARHYREAVPVIPGTTPIKLCDRCLGEGEVPGVCGGTYCWDCGHTCGACHGTGGVAR